MFRRYFGSTSYVVPMLFALLGATSAQAFEGWLTVKNDADVNVDYTITYGDVVDRQSLAPGESLLYKVTLNGKNPPLPTATLTVRGSTINDRVKFNWRAEKGSFATITSTRPDAVNRRILRLSVTNEPKPK